MRFLRLVAILLAPAMLWGCLLTPGAFTAEMTIAADGGFTYAYRGEIVLAGADMPPGGAAAAGPPICYKETTGQERPCTPAEIAEQALQPDLQGMDEMQREMMRVFMGGVDPSDDASMRAFAERLSGQNGWRSVAYRGNGVFDVDFAIEGRLDRAFVFPVAADLALILPMVSATPRGDGTVIVQAPALMGGADSTAAAGVPAAGVSTPRPEGSFTLSTAGAVVETNAMAREEEAGGTVLRWTVDETERARPTATVRLAAR